MDSEEIMPNVNAADIMRLSDPEKHQLEAFLQAETQKAQVQKRTYMLSLSTPRPIATPNERLNIPYVLT
jgi:hypothetical protein